MVVLKKTFLALCLSISGFSHADDIFNSGKTPNFDIPEIGSGVGLIDQQKERMIGEKVYRQVQYQMPVLHDVWLEDQFMTIFSRILSQTKLGSPIGLVIINDPQINAFAVPGGLFALNSGLITSAKNLDEITGVMAHEIAHVSQRHFSRSQEAFKGQGLLVLAGLLVGAAITSQVDGDVGGAVMMGTQAALADRQLSYSRNQEREADRIGMQLMYSAGYNPHSMADFFETMNRATARVSFMPDFWFTHPLTTQRMSEARLRANQLPRTPLSNTQQDFDIIKWYSAVLTSQASEVQLKALAQNKNVGGLLALAKYYLQKGELDAAQAQLNIVSSIVPHHTLLALIQADLMIEKKQIDQAKRIIESKHKIMPENRALAFKLADIYNLTNQPDQANRIVQKFIQKNDRDIVAWQIMQQAANIDKSNPLHTVNVLRYRAEVEYWKGQEESAIRSLLHAQRLAKDNNSMSAKITSRVKQMQMERQQKI